ncbi:unnamed protein product [Peronospora destructor]|uniref:Uncharacterized protein n=1 Tax=Peronospora destructor TaxID=86335 RepID=A0AAV0UPA4_9STRA|nr:unnamed protein product [Peronospora destructor]
MVKLRACFVNHKVARYTCVTPPSIHMRLDEEATRTAAAAATVTIPGQVSPSGDPIPAVSTEFTSSLRNSIRQQPSMSSQSFSLDSPSLPSQILSSDIPSTPSPTHDPHSIRW